MPPSPPPAPAAATGETPPLRVLLVEDDALVRQLLAMVWDDYAIELLTCSEVAQAVAQLRQGPVDLIVTDLMLPGESGLGLLSRLAAEPALRGTARVAVFSAGLGDGTRAQLQAFDVWRVLRKPLPISELQDCVEAIGARLRDAAAGDGPAPTQRPAAATSEAAEAAVAEHFGDNRALYTAFRDAATAQFSQDIAAGDAALRAADAPALRRLAHSLKSVLRSLGHGAFANLAAALEASAEQADWPAARPQWAALRRALDELARNG